MKPQGNPLAFVVGQTVRYKPGIGTYGYEAAVEADGRIPAVVVGHSPSKVRIRFAMSLAGWKPKTIERGVAAASLQVVASAVPV